MKKISRLFTRLKKKNQKTVLSPTIFPMFASSAFKFHIGNGTKYVKIIFVCPANLFNSVRKVETRLGQCGILLAFLSSMAILLQ